MHFAKQLSIREDVFCTQGLFFRVLGHCLGALSILFVLVIEEELLVVDEDIVIYLLLDSLD